MRKTFILNYYWIIWIWKLYTQSAFISMLIGWYKCKLYNEVKAIIWIKGNYVMAWKEFEHKIVNTHSAG